MSKITANSFSGIYSDLKNRSLKDTKHLRYQETKGLYLHTSISFRSLIDLFGCFAAVRKEKRKQAGCQIWHAVRQEYGEKIANQVFGDVFGNNDTTHETPVTWGDMKAINSSLQEINCRQQAEASEIDDIQEQAKTIASNGEYSELESLIRDNLEHFTPEFVDSLDENVQPLVRKIVALYYYKAMADESESGEGYQERTFNQCLQLIGLPTRAELTKLPPADAVRDLKSSKLDPSKLKWFTPLEESTKKWMLDQIYLKLFKKESAGIGQLSSNEWYEETYNKDSAAKLQRLESCFRKDNVKTVATAIHLRLNQSITEIGPSLPESKRTNDRKNDPELRRKAHPKSGATEIDSQLNQPTTEIGQSWDQHKSYIRKNLDSFLPESVNNLAEEIKVPLKRRLALSCYDEMAFPKDDTEGYSPARFNQFLELLEINKRGNELDLKRRELESKEESCEPLTEPTKRWMLDLINKELYPQTQKTAFVDSVMGGYPSGDEDSKAKLHYLETNHVSEDDRERIAQGIETIVKSEPNSEARA